MTKKKTKSASSAANTHPARRGRKKATDAGPKRRPSKRGTCRPAENSSDAQRAAGQIGAVPGSEQIKEEGMLKAVAAAGTERPSSFPSALTDEAADTVARFLVKAIIKLSGDPDRAGDVLGDQE